MGVYLNGAGYGDWKFCPRTLRERASIILPHLREAIRVKGADSIAVRGTSGVCMAWTLLGMGLDVPVLLARKANEGSHGSQFEGMEGHSYSRYLILDDFTASGATVTGMIDDITRYGNLRGDVLECVGLFFHHNAEMPDNSGNWSHRPFVCEQGKFDQWGYN